ncbi:hypothetical protein F442_13165 [Phytophthora nicotianae P10297]|uniref:START domain-containing protein n=1 Tax=Phytophthora nicotianae P10297 TaxID=1317064 RepID=W2YWI6_PHYNI|nr:hypothetical protein F442_13165 [Phytophthora nicotianae P10297]
MIADNPVELQVGMPPTDQLSTNATITCDFDVLEEFLEEMKAFDCQPATSTPARKGCSKRSTKRSKQPYKNPNPVWKRRKEELRNLRIETKELETQVAFLRLRDTHAKLFDECMGTTKGQELWKAAAKREREGYQQAQAENSHLKQSIKRYKKISDTLQAALENVENNASSLQGEMRIVHGLRLLGTTVFNRLECRVQARLQELDTFLHDNRTTTEACDADQIRIYQQESLHPVSVVEFTRNRLMPFSAEKTSTSVWDIMKLGDFLNEKLISTPSEDDMASEGWYNQPLKCGGTAMLRSHCLKKRVAIPGGFAVLVEAISEWSAYPTSSAPWRYVTRDTGWAFVYPLDTNGSTSMCRVQTLLRLTTADSNEAVTGNQHIAQTQLTTSVGEVVITSFREMIQSRHQLLENALLDSSRTSAACTLSG